MRFVARCTYHPAEDIQRNWSAPVGGFFSGDLWVPGGYASQEAAIEAYLSFSPDSGRVPEFRYHPAYGGYVEVHYEGLGAYELEAESLEEAIEEAVARFGDCPEDMIVTLVSEDGHFMASEVLEYAATPVPGLYVFVLD